MERQNDYILVEVLNVVTSFSLFSSEVKEYQLSKKFLFP